MNEKTDPGHPNVTIDAVAGVHTLNATRADVETQLEAVGGLQGAILLVKRMNATRINDEGRAFLRVVEAIARNPKVRVVVQVHTEGDAELDGQVARVVIGE